MPELPEVEVVCQGLQSVLLGRKVMSCTGDNLPLRLPVPGAKIQRWVVGSEVVSIFRRAKYVVIQMGSEAWMVIHLGMTGKLGMFSGQTPRVKHDHLCFVLDNEMEFRFNDTRRFGSIQVFEPGQGDGFFAGLGVEPLTKAFTVSSMRKKATRRTQPIKNFIMDSRVVVGIGNIYASEILHEAAIHPSRLAREVTGEEWRQIISCSKQVLRKAIAAGGSTIADFVGSSGEKGYFQLQLKVYGRRGKKCHCGSTIHKTVMAGRATFFCDNCQG